MVIHLEENLYKVRKVIFIKSVKCNPLQAKNDDPNSSQQEV